ncbi:protein phosphatase 2C domain-containing protein [Rarobacter faecitabidus]|uniref:Serine/threonine protein phosphatase PstP n=1 Tax=Rarobacter faecitabidus TaxID=13243 RepID=A0A542ZPA4_RARFA|nr:Stp1/IreP family PP2C-type Ser/Thr phosphatase [Rarobacter faecitabidus]TQL62182.1 protein phosphatase [Rarobacter faecitabidus]
MSIALRYAAISDVGLVRANNQDSAYAGPHLLAVADGMGGHAGGDTASSLAIAKLAPLDDEALGSGDIVKRLKDTIEEARLELVAYARSHPKVAGMGTTITTLLRSGNKIAMAHMGDSRAYLLHKDEFTQVTVDHTFVQHLVDTGRITPEEAENHPQRSVVMRVLGDFEVELTPDVSMREAHVGDRWLLCSDGLSGYVAHDTIKRTLEEYEDPAQCAEKLVQLALRAGGPDNITAIVADVIDLDEHPDGAVEQPNVQVVGAAAVSRDDVTSAQDGPAARAASLAASVASQEESEPAVDQPSAVDLRDVRRRRWLPWTIVAVVLALIAGAAGFGYRWTQQQYFIGVQGTTVTLFRGIPQSLGPFDLATAIEVTGVDVATLPEPTRSSVAAGQITASSREELAQRWQEVTAETVAAPSAQPPAEVTTPTDESSTPAESAPAPNGTDAGGQ